MRHLGEIEAVPMGDGGWEIRAAWGTLHVIDGNVQGLQQLMLPSLSLAPVMAKGLSEHLALAAEKAALADDVPRTAGEIAATNHARQSEASEALAAGEQIRRSVFGSDR